MPRKDRKPARRLVEPNTTATLESLQGNALLRCLAPAEAVRTAAAGELIDMPSRYMIYRAGEPIIDVFFPTDSVLSVVTVMEDGGAIEVGTIGREGTSGIPLLMGGETTENDCYCQVPGHAIKISLLAFRHLQATDASFRTVLNRYLQAYVNFLGQLSGCNRLHSVYERCARWLLLTHDRVGCDDIALTHEYLAMMLGSRRSGVTIALATLQRAGYIKYANGCITIIDREGLEDTSCECYAVAEKQFSPLLRVAPRNGVAV